MKTNFFEQMAGLQLNGNLLLNINTDDTGILTVSAIIKKSSLTASNSLPPMLFKGTAQELDEDFFGQLAQPVKQTSGLITNLETYQKELDKAKKNAGKSDKDKTTQSSASEPDDDDNNEPENLFTPAADDKQLKAEKTRHFNEALDRSKELAKQMKYTEALAQLPEAGEHPDKAELIEAKRQEIQAGKDIYDKLLNQFKD
jgi:PRTRC genetic system protein E